MRVLLGEKEKKRVYRIAVIRGIENSDAVYKIGDSFTTKLLILNWGSALKTFKMDFISNGDFTPDEFTEWVDQMQKCNMPMVTSKDIDKKIKHIKSFILRKRQMAAGKIMLFSVHLGGAYAKGARVLGGVCNNIVSGFACCGHSS